MVVKRPLLYPLKSKSGGAVTHTDVATAKQKMRLGEADKDNVGLLRRVSRHGIQMFESRRAKLNEKGSVTARMICLIRSLIRTAWRRRSSKLTVGRER